MDVRYNIRTLEGEQDLKKENLIFIFFEDIFKFEETFNKIEKLKFFFKKNNIKNEIVPKLNIVDGKICILLGNVSNEEDSLLFEKFCLNILKVKSFPNNLRGILEHKNDIIIGKKINIFFHQNNQIEGLSQKIKQLSESKFKFFNFTISLKKLEKKYFFSLEFESENLNVEKQDILKIIKNTDFYKS